MDEKFNLKEFHANIEEMGYSLWTMGRLPEGSMYGYQLSEGDHIILELWNGKHWHFKWVGGIGVVIKTLDSIGSDKEYIEKERVVIEDVIAKINYAKT